MLLKSIILKSTNCYNNVYKKLHGEDIKKTIPIFLMLHKGSMKIKTLSLSLRIEKEKVILLNIAKVQTKILVTVYFSIDLQGFQRGISKVILLILFLLSR